MSLVPVRTFIKDKLHVSFLICVKIRKMQAPWTNLGFASFSNNCLVRFKVPHVAPTKLPSGLY